MLRLGIHQARAGMALGHPVWHPEVPGTVLLKRGASLTAPVIARLRQLGVMRVWVGEPEIDSVNESYSSDLRRARAAVADRIGSIVAVVRGRAAGEPDFAGLREAVTGVVDQIRAQPGSATYTEDLGAGIDPFVRHAESVAFLSMLIGSRLGFYLSHERPRVAPTVARDLVPLGLGAAMADIGLATLAPEDFALVIRAGEGICETSVKTEAFRERALELWHEHPRRGYDLVHSKIEPAAANAVLHHHQCWDGSGFPQRQAADGAMRPLSGRDIHVYARVVAAADRFCRLRIWGEAGTEVDTGLEAAVESSGMAMPTVRVLRLLQSQPLSPSLDIVVVRGLVASVPAFAPGDVVELSDGRPAVVTGHVPEHPCEPGLQALRFVEGEGDAGHYETDGNPLPMKPSEQGINVRVTEGSDVSGDLFFPKHPGTYDLAVIERAIYQRSAASASGRAA